MPKSRPDDPFEDDWGMPDAPAGESSDEMPQESSEERPPFLKPHHVGSQKTGTMELVRVTAETSDYSDVIFLVSVRGKQFRLGMRLFSPDYKALKKKFGAKRSDWHGSLKYKVLPHKGNPDGYVSVRPA
jgi:hypothetical protein